jgi:transposase
MAMPAAIKSKRQLQAALKKGKTQAAAAKILGVSGAAVRRAMDRFNIKRAKAGKPKPKKVAWSKTQLQALMLESGWDMAHAAKLTGVGTETIARQLAKHGVRERRKKLGRPSVADVVGKDELRRLISRHRGRKKHVLAELGLTNPATLDNMIKRHGLDQLDCLVGGKVTKKRLLELLRIHKGSRAGVADALCITSNRLSAVSSKHKISARHKPGWTFVPRGRTSTKTKASSPIAQRAARGKDVHALMGASVSEATGRASGVLRGRRARAGMSREESIAARKDPAYLWLKERGEPGWAIAGNPRFRVRSPAQGLRVIQHQDITANYKKALRFKPKHKRAVLVPCAQTKPFPDAPSHRGGYLAALEGKPVDVFVVSEPLGVVPYAWSRRYPQADYDFPPAHLRGEGRALLVHRIADWFCTVGKHYQKVTLALPRHHMDLVEDALDSFNRLPTNVDYVGIGDCLDAGVCPPGHYRATSQAYRGFLRARVNPPVRHNGLSTHYCGRCYEELAPMDQSSVCERCEHELETAAMVQQRMAGNPLIFRNGLARSSCWRCGDEVAPGTLSRHCFRCERELAAEAQQAEVALQQRMAGNPCGHLVAHNP